MIRRQVSPPPVEKAFKLLEDSREIDRLLEQASMAKSRADVRFGSADGERIPCKVEEPSNATEGLCMRLPPVVTPEMEKGLRTGDLPGECLAIIFLRGHSLLGVRSTQILVEGPTLKLKPPCRYFVMQRRHEARFDIPRGYEFWINLPAVEGDERRVRKRLLDLSASGLGFQVLSPREADLYSVGKVFNDVRFMLHHQEVSVDLEVCNHAPVPPEMKLGGTKIGCKVIRVSAPDANQIESFVATRLVGF